MADTPDDLMRAVLLAPGEDAPRLRFAEWLTARGDPRGENKIRIFEKGLTLGQLPLRAWSGKKERVGGVIGVQRFKRIIVPDVLKDAQS
jgi:uncharacterized protein (TIGR02996 family)